MPKIVLMSTTASTVSLIVLSDAAPRKEAAAERSPVATPAVPKADNVVLVLLVSLEMVASVNPLIVPVVRISL